MRGLIYRLVSDALKEDSGRRIPVNEMRAEVSRDLELLLNTRSEAARALPDIFKECRSSSLTFGIPDFSAYSLLSPQDRERIKRALEQAIALHEGRLTRVRVTLDPQREGGVSQRRAVRLRRCLMLRRLRQQAHPPLDREVRQ